ncbi:MAG: glycosyltransferase [Steroidobacteraceae bacterium]
MRVELSVVIPVFNEGAVLPLLFARLYPALDALGRRYEVIFVDDGSADESVALLREQFAARPHHTRALILGYNAGQHAAILAGFSAARGSYVVTLDSDLQNPPEEIGAVVATLDQGFDCVGTVRQGRRDPWWRRSISRMLNRIREKTTRIHITDQGCMLRGYRRNVVDAINRCREVSTFIPALAYTFARRPTEIEVRHEKRAAGKSKYSLFSLIRLNFDLMTGYSLLPLQFISLAGILIATVSMGFVVFLLVRRLVIGPEAQGLFTLFALMFFLIGVLLFGLGVVGEYVGRIYQQVRQRPAYEVAEVLEEETGEYSRRSIRSP